MRHNGLDRGSVLPSSCVCVRACLRACVSVCLFGRKELRHNSCYALKLHTHVHTKAYTCNMLCCLGVVMDHRHADTRH